MNNNYEESADEFFKTDFSKNNYDFYKVENGTQKIRILSSMKPYFTSFNKATNSYFESYNYFTGASNRYLTYVLDYKDNKIKIFKMPKTLAAKIKVLGADEEYKFSSFPMPYDIKITATNAGTTEVEYEVVGAKVNTEIDSKILEEYSKKKKVHEVLDAMIKKSEKKTEKEVEDYNETSPVKVPDSIDYGDAIDPEDIPF